MPFERIAVLGAGSWGTALANTACRAGRSVTMWSHDPDEIEAIKGTGETPRLPGVAVDPRIVVTLSLEEALKADAALLVVPAQAVRSVAEKIAGKLVADTPVVVCAKGIERGTNNFMSDIIAACVPQAMPAILSGPSFAADVARGLPTAVTLAAPTEATAAALAQALASPTFRPYHSTDLRGVEIGGATKNVLAIAAGIVHGRALGASAAAALISRGFAELARFGRHFGARPETLTGLSGLGDLILTCSSPQSRNFAYGVSLGRGKADMGGKLVEGALTAPVVVAMARQHQIEMPISTAVAAILEGTISIDKAIENLLNRPIGAEV